MRRLKPLLSLSLPEPNSLRAADCLSVGISDTIPTPAHTLELAGAMLPNWTRRDRKDKHCVRQHRRDRNRSDRVAAHDPLIWRQVRSADLNQAHGPARYHPGRHGLVRLSSVGVQHRTENTVWRWTRTFAARWSQNIHLGEMEYLSSCAACHGVWMETERGRSAWS